MNNDEITITKELLIWAYAVSTFVSTSLILLDHYTRNKISYITRIHIAVCIVMTSLATIVYLTLF